MTRVTRVGGDGLQDYVLAPTGGEEGSEETFAFKRRTNLSRTWTCRYLGGQQTIRYYRRKT